MVLSASTNKPDAHPFGNAHAPVDAAHSDMLIADVTEPSIFDSPGTLNVQKNYRVSFSDQKKVKS